MSLISVGLKSIFESLIARLGAVAFGFTTGIILARYLSVADRGQYAYLGVICGIAVQFLHFGLPSANGYFLASGRMSVGHLLGVTLSFVAVQGIVLGLISILNFFTPFGHLIGLSQLEIFMLAICIPVNLFFLLGMGSLQGLNYLRAYNIFDTGFKALTLMGVCLLLLTGYLTAQSAFASTQIVLAITCILIFLVLSRKGAPSLKQLRLEDLLSHSRYSFRSYLALLFGYMMLKQDIILIKYYLSPVELGLYSVISNINDMIFLIPAVFGFVLFPKFSAISDFKTRLQMLAYFFKILFVVMLFVVLIAFCLSDFLIPTIFGRSYVDAVRPFKILVMGALFYGPNTVLSVFLASCGNPTYYVLTWMIGMLTNLTLNLILFHNFEIGIDGVALISVFSYALVFLLQLFYILGNRNTGIKGSDR